MDRPSRAADGGRSGARVAPVADAPPAMTIAPPASRNDACPCGSGKRYKHCHGAGALVHVPPAAHRPASADGEDLRRRAEAAPDPAFAETEWARVLAAHPGDAEALFHLGNLAQARGEHAAAIARFEEALAVEPENPRLLNNLGLALDRATGMRDLPAAEAVFRRAVAAMPAGFDARANLAQNLYQQQRFEDALSEFDRLVAEFPVTHAAIWANRAVCQIRCGDPDGALAGFRRAIELAPGTASLHCDAGALLWAQKRFEDAHDELARCLELDAGNALAARLLAVVQNYLADWDDFPARRARLLAETTDSSDSVGAAAGRTRTSFNVQAICDDPALELRLARSWMREVAATNCARPARAPAADRRLRLGFVSLDFCDHPVGRLVVNLFERLDRARFSVTAYANGPAAQHGGGPAVSDPVRDRIARSVDRFRETGRTDAAAIARVIRGDGIDVLFDLNGFTQRLADIFALRPAPMQVNFLGYTGTLGLDCYDFIVSDRYCLRDEDRVHYAEQPLYVDPCYLPSDSTRTADPAAIDRAAYGLPADAFVLYVAAAPYKIMPEMYDLWVRLLHARPDAVLWLRGSEPSTMARLRAEAARRGEDPARLVFAPSDPHSRYLARFQLADLMLDTFPFGAHTGVNDALFAGLPALTLSGGSFASRASASQLLTAGLPELVATSADDYIATGQRLMQDPGALSALTQRLRAQGRTNPLFDTERYARSFGSAIESAWRSMRFGRDAG